MPPAALLRRAPLPTRAVDGELVVLDNARGLVHRLNETAALIWSYCDGTASLQQITERFASDVQRAPNDVLADVCTTVAELDRLGLLETGPPEPLP